MIINKPTIFLSYARDDMVIAEKIYNDLSRLELDVLLKAETNRFGQHLGNEIKSAIELSNYFLVLLSLKSIQENSSVQLELQEAFKISENLPDTKVFIIPVRIEDCTILQKELNKLNWIDLFPENKYAKGICEILKLVNQDIYILRNKFTEISEHDVLRMIRKYDFYDSRFNFTGNGLFHRYKQLEINKAKIIIDGTTKLIWQQGGSDKKMPITDVDIFINKLNNICLAGYNDWRIPTLEEAMSLLEPKDGNTNLFLNSIFNTLQEEIWTSDSTPGEWGTQRSTWYYYVTFKYGCYLFGGLEHIYEPDFSRNLTGMSVEELYDAEEIKCFVRAVRSNILQINENDIDEYKISEDRMIDDENEDLPF
jgi:hypothetical protein